MTRQRFQVGHRDAIRSTVQIESGVIGGILHVVVIVTFTLLFEIPESVTSADLDELRAAGFEVTVDYGGGVIARGPGAPWWNPAAYELARLRFRRGRGTIR